MSIDIDAAVRALAASPASGQAWADLHAAATAAGLTSWAEAAARFVAAPDSQARVDLLDALIGGYPSGAETPPELVAGLSALVRRGKPAPLKMMSMPPAA